MKIHIIALIILVLTSTVMAAIEPNGWLDCCGKTNNNISIRFNVIDNSGRDKGYIQIGKVGEDVKNVTVSDESIFSNSRYCCDYVFDKDQCLKCADEFEKEIGYAKNKTKIYFVALVAILFFGIIIWFIIKKLKGKDI